MQQQPTHEWIKPELEEISLNCEVASYSNGEMEPEPTPLIKK